MVEPSPADTVHGAFPGSRVESAGEGQMSAAFVVDDTLIVRVPRHAHGIEQLRHEVEILAAVRAHLPLPTPVFTHVVLDVPVGKAYVAHRRLSGKVLIRDDVTDMSTNRIRIIGRQIGTFLKELHTVDLAMVPGVSRYSIAQVADRLRQGAESLLRPRLMPNQFAALLDDIAALRDLSSRPTVLVHADIGGNLLIDEYDNVSVIDFGSCVASHPALDAASLSVLGDAIYDSAAVAYPLLAQLSVDVAAVRATFLLQDALHAAVQEDWQYLEELFDLTS